MTQAQSPRRTAARKPARPAKPAAARPQVAPPPPDGDAQTRVVRDGFTMPEDDYATLKALKAQCLKAGVEVKKSELLRAGVRALAALPAARLVEQMRALPAVKTGRKKNRV